MLDSNKMI